MPIHIVLCDCISLERENAERVKTSPLATVNMAIGAKSVTLIRATTIKR
jgi:hypothetical protein